MVRRGKVNYALAVRQVKTFMPEGMREEFLKGIDACKDIGNSWNFQTQIYCFDHICLYFFVLFIGADMDDNCDKSYAILKCFFDNNEHFMFP